MAASDKNSIELARIMRKKDSLEGAVFSHLQSHGRPQAELVCETLRAYWLPLALKRRGAKGKELKSQAIVAIAQLMQQIEIIRLECGLHPDEMPFGDRLHMLSGVVPVKSVAVPTAKASPPTVVEDTGDDDDDEFLSAESADWFDGATI